MAADIPVPWCPTRRRKGPSMGPRPSGRGYSLRRKYSVFKHLPAGLRAPPGRSPLGPRRHRRRDRNLVRTQQFTPRERTLHFFLHATSRVPRGKEAIGRSDLAATPLAAERHDARCPVGWPLSHVSSTRERCFLTRVSPSLRFRPPSSMLPRRWSVPLLSKNALIPDLPY